MRSLLDIILQWTDGLSVLLSPVLNFDILAILDVKSCCLHLSFESCSIYQRMGRPVDRSNTSRFNLEAEERTSRRGRRGGGNNSNRSRARSSGEWKQIDPRIFRSPALCLITALVRVFTNTVFVLTISHILSFMFNFFVLKFSPWVRALS